MKIRNIKYFISQGFKGLISNSLMTLASIGIVVASLVIFGFFLLLGMNLNTVGEQIKEQCMINVFISNDYYGAVKAPDENSGEGNADEPLISSEELEERRIDAVRSIGAQLANIEHVKEYQLYTKNERFADYKNGVYKEQAAVIESLEMDNPLRDAYRLTLSNHEMANQVAEAAGKIEGVEQVVNRQDLMQQILSITNTIRLVSVWILLVLVFISVFIISNTIKLGMFARRKEINIMKFVGATDWFIRWPFIIEGMLLGAVGAVAASLIVLLGYGSVLPNIQQFMGDITLLTSKEVTTMIVLAFMALGMGIGMIGSGMSIRKHLHV